MDQLVRDVTHLSRVTSGRRHVRVVLPAGVRRVAIQGGAGTGGNARCRGETCCEEETDGKPVSERQQCEIMGCRRAIGVIPVIGIDRS